MYSYYEAQMQLLRQAGRLFAEQYPEHARQLNMDGLSEPDPHVERLLEGVAFLTGHIQQRLDESVPEIAEQILQKLCPVLLQPYPSVTVLQFSPLPNAQETVRIAKGIEVDSPVNERLSVACRFRTCHPLSVVPLAVNHVSCRQRESDSELRLHMQWRCLGDKRRYNLSTLRFFIRGDRPVVSSLLQLMTCGDESIDIVSRSGATPWSINLPASACTLAFGTPESALLPDADSGHPGFALLHDYFCCPERFCFVELSGLAVEMLVNMPHEFEVVFHSKASLPSGFRVTTDHLLLNCTPAVNLFSEAAEPVRLDSDRLDYRLIPARELQPADSHFVYGVEQVRGIARLTGQVHDYSPCYLDRSSSSHRVYSLHRRDNGGPLPVLYLQLPMAAELEDQCLSVDVTVSNGHWPRQLLAEGDLCQGSRTMPTTVAVANVIRPTASLPPLAENHNWSLISLLAMQLSTLRDIAQLRRLLHFLTGADTVTMPGELTH